MHRWTLGERKWLTTAKKRLQKVQERRQGERRRVQNHNRQKRLCIARIQRRETISSQEKEGAPNGSDSKGKGHKGADAEGKDGNVKGPNGKVSKGKDGKEKNPKGGKTSPKVEKDTGESRGIYSSHTTREQNWGPTKRRNEYARTHRINQDKWENKDGNRRAPDIRRMGK